MAKKKTPEDTSALSAPARRRATATKRDAQSAAATANETATASKPVAGNETPGPTQAEIAEAAYFRHLNRGGNQGDEFSDWIEAERELRERSR
jgi:hypothetical protein